MRILTIALCILSVLCMGPWAQLKAEDSPDSLMEVKLAGSKSLAHLIDLSGSQDGMAPQKTDLPQAIVGTVVSGDPGLKKRQRTD